MDLLIHYSFNFAFDLRVISQMDNEAFYKIKYQDHNYEESTFEVLINSLWLTPLPGVTNISILLKNLVLCWATAYENLENDQPGISAMIYNTFLVNKKNLTEDCIISIR